MWKVLVIEDDPMLAEIHKRYIEGSDDFVCVDVIYDAKTALLKVDELKPDLIFLDVYLPQMNGLEFLMKLRESGKQIDVILITAARNLEQVETAYRYGAIDYLVKPFEYSRLKQALESFKLRKQIPDSKIPLDQLKIDECFGRNRNKPDVVLPKGLHELTLDRVKRTMDGFDKAITIEEIVEIMEMSKVTLRRYLDYLEKIGYIEIEMSYGTRGRPSYLYKRKKIHT